MMSANRPFFKLSIVGAALLGLAALPPSAVAQHEHDNPSGYPLDWSNSHVKYGTAGNLKDQEKFESDPRYLRQRDEDRRKWEKLADDDASGHRRDHKHGAGSDLTVDWAVSLANGSVAQGMSPAVISGGTESCSDMVIYALNVTGNTTSTTGGLQANLIGVNNIYSTCTGSPSVAFAYADTAGPIATSPVPSFYDNGAQIAFVANEGGKATFRVVKYSTAASNGTTAAAPVALPGTGSQTTALAFSTTTDTNSSPYIDYLNDIAYVGDDAGVLWKITPVFGGGTPVATKLATLAGKLTGPVLDNANGVVLVGSSNGDLYARLASTGATVTGSPLAVGDGSTSGGIVDPPVIVEEGIGLTTDAFVTTGCTGSDAALSEASETAAGLASLYTSPSGAGGIGDAHGCGSNNLHAPALDDNSYNGLAGNGYVCGTVIRTTAGGGGPEAPVLYSFTFPAGGGTIALTTHTLTPTANAASECSPITYFTSNSTQKIFMGIGYATGGTVNSNTVLAGVFSATTQDTTPSALGGTSGIVVDNSSATASQANVYFTGLAAGNVTAPVGGTAGNCKSFAVGGSSSGGTVTLTGIGLNFSFGSPIVVSGFTGTEAAFNGTWTVATTTSTTSLTYAIPTLGVITTTSGTASWGTCGFQMTQSGLS